MLVPEKVEVVIRQWREKWYEESMMDMMEVGRSNRSSPMSGAEAEVKVSSLADKEFRRVYTLSIGGEMLRHFRRALQWVRIRMSGRGVLPLLFCLRILAPR